MKYLEWKNLDGRMDMLGPAMKVVQGKLIDWCQMLVECNWLYVNVMRMMKEQLLALFIN
jgi:hypothetical protein